MEPRSWPPSRPMISSQRFYRGFSWGCFFCTILPGSPGPRLRPYYAYPVYASDTCSHSPHNGVASFDLDRARELLTAAGDLDRQHHCSTQSCLRLPWTQDAESQRRHKSQARSQFITPKTPRTIHGHTAPHGTLASKLRGHRVRTIRFALDK